MLKVVVVAACTRIPCALVVLVAACTVNLNYLVLLQLYTRTIFLSLRLLVCYHLIITLLLQVTHQHCTM
jgi:hypothetical protein